MSKFRPINKDHAITSVAVGLKLDEFVEPPTLAAITQSNASWRAFLPAVLPLPLPTLNVGNQAVEVPAVQFAVVRPDARPLWSLKFSGFDLITECAAYTRWADVWKQAKLLLDEAYAAVRATQADANILEMSLQVTDVFLTDAEEYAISDIIKPGNMIGDRLMSEGGLWHANLGWFVYGNDYRVLHGLNSKVTRDRRPSGEFVGPYTLNITHVQRTMPTSSSPLEISRLDEVVCAMHEDNKREIKRLLVPDALNQVGLG